MKIALSTALFALAAAAPAMAQTTGVSNPPAAMIEATPDDAPAPVLHPKPSAAAPVQPQHSRQRRASRSSTSRISRAPVVHSYTAAGSSAASDDPDAGVVTTAPSTKPEDYDAGVVTDVPSRPNEVPIGTLLRTRIHETISTASTPLYAPFSAEVVAPMEREGRVIIPIGSILHGRVTQIRGGHRISGAAAIHLLPESVTLPDGTIYDPARAGRRHRSVQRQPRGRRRHRHSPRPSAETLAAMSMATGGAAAAGAVVGGGVGAVVGAGIGAGVSTVWWLKQDRQEQIPQDTGITFTLVGPMEPPRRPWARANHARWSVSGNV